MRELIDLSHTVYDGLVTFKGLPGPIICDYLSREASRKNYTDGTEFQIGRIDMVSNTGTYIDCPFHRYADGKDLSQTALDRFVDLPALVVRAPFSERNSASASAGRGPSSTRSPATNNTSGAASRPISFSTASSATTLP